MIRVLNHIDEVDHDDSTDVTKPKLAHQLLGCLEVVLSNRFFEVSSGSNEFPGVDINHRHRLGAINHEGASGWEVNLSIQCLGYLVAYEVAVEDVGLLLVLHNPLHEVWGNSLQILTNRFIGSLATNYKLLEVLIEYVTNDLYQKVRLTVECGWSLAGLRLPRDLFPLRLKPLHVQDQLLFRGTLSGRSDDYACIFGKGVLENLLEPLTLTLWQLS